MITGARALVAQLVEQRFCKPKVGGSIPSGGTSTLQARQPSPLESLDFIQAGQPVQRYLCQTWREGTSWSRCLAVPTRTP